MVKKFQGATGLKVAVIGDEDTVVGFLMAGIGTKDGQGRTNFQVVTPKTRQSDIEDTFKAFTTRQDVAVVLINQHVAEQIRHVVDMHTAIVPTVLEIPSKSEPYDAAKDSVMQRVKFFFGGQIPDG
ncbi:MAG: uncharacterized protein KVP18_004803 [Porospora cf. gigantea A]|uniref:uncharacterized protein n=1 Tax=Porospora cf. gigantea A TaxID=2853593 RepID=UPI00355995CE|nr:MAG: hypothetical protein KVP18_004803 [Porospora cf. gigantea A]